MSTTVGAPGGPGHSRTNVLPRAGSATKRPGGRGGLTVAVIKTQGKRYKPAIVTFPASLTLRLRRLVEGEDRLSQTSDAIPGPARVWLTSRPGDPIGIGPLP